MTTIVHRTPGLIPIEAFTLIGVSAKPNSTNPIGQFGTGLKYAIAVLVRMGASPVVYIGLDRYEFYSEKGTFRGAEFDKIRMRRKKWSLTRATNHDLPFSTNYGRWWKPWMVFRELEANTRDEGGETFEVNDTWEGPDKDHSCILVELEDYAEAFKDRDKIFLPSGLSVREGSWAVQVLEGGSSHLYYRGMRAKDLGKPTLLTYNFLADSISLTEDRQIAYEWEVRSHLAQHIITSEDEDFIEAVLTCSNVCWEHNIDFPLHVKPSEAFKAVVARNPKRLFSNAYTYYNAHVPKPEKPRVKNQLELHEGPWVVEGNQVLDAAGVVMFEKPGEYTGDWEMLCEKMFRLCMRDDPAKQEPEPEEMSEEEEAHPGDYEEPNILLLQG